MKTLISGVTLICILALASHASDIDATNKYAWSENTGWTNWRDAGSPAGQQGIRIHGTFLSGFAWSENAGWINLGDGTPADGVEYANLAGDDFGVNLDPQTDELFGLAWGENVGWINFDGGAAADPTAPARIVTGPNGCRISGFVWAENIGWINLSDAQQYVALTPQACLGGPLGDMNCDGALTVSDIAGFVLAVTSWLNGCDQYQQAFPECFCLNADMNDDGAVTVSDIGPFVLALTSGG